MAAGVAINQVGFSWEGTDNRGNKVRGKTMASSEAAVRAVLRKQGVVPVRIRKESTLFKGGGKVTPGDIAIFSRQIATMLAAGIPLVQAFDIVGAGHDKPAMQKLILDIKLNIEGGSTLRGVDDGHSGSSANASPSSSVPMRSCTRQSGCRSQRSHVASMCLGSTCAAPAT